MFRGALNRAGEVVADVWNLDGVSDLAVEQIGHRRGIAIWVGVLDGRSYAAMEMGRPCRVFPSGIFTAQYRQFKSFGRMLAAKALAVFYSAYRKL